MNKNECLFLRKVDLVYYDWDEVYTVILKAKIIENPAYSANIDKMIYCKSEENAISW